MKHLVGTLLLFGTLAINESLATSLLVEGNSRFGVATLTLDSSTGLQWLDLPLTVGLNYYDMQAQLGPGGTFAGFRYATRAEVLTLWQDAGIPYVGIGISTEEQQANFGPVTALESLIGLTSTFNQHTIGMIAEFNAPGMSQRPTLWSPGPSLAMAAIGEWASGSTSPDVGHWLVAVPEPSTLPLLSFGALAVALARRRAR